MEHTVGPPAGLMIGFIVFYALIIALGIASMVFWIIALVDVTRREFKDPNEKLIWVLVILLAQVIGALVYWFVGRENGVVAHVNPKPAPPPPTMPPAVEPPPQ